MTDMLIVTGIIALFGYGYWLMGRLDRFVGHSNGHVAHRFRG